MAIRKGTCVECVALIERLLLGVECVALIERLLLGVRLELQHGDKNELSN